MHLFRVLAGAQIGLFSSLPVNSRYAVLLLSVFVIMYFALSLKLVRFQAGAFGGVAAAPGAKAVSPAPAAPLAAAPEDSFREHGLSKREREIGFLVLQGQTNLEIAKRLCIEEITVKKHINSIFSKYGVGRRTEFMAKFIISEK
jgi:DNA-binding CsgD family transcriptional regulator